MDYIIIILYYHYITKLINYFNYQRNFKYLIALLEFIFIIIKNNFIVCFIPSKLYSIYANIYY